SLEIDRAGDARRRLRHEAHDGIGGDRLARSAFADERDGFAGLDAERHAVDGLDPAVWRRKLHVQSLDGQRPHDYNRFAMRGSVMSRSPSPRRLTARTVIDRNSAGKKTTNGFTCQITRPSDMMPPQDGMIAGVAAPMKDRIASMI